MAQQINAKLQATIKIHADFTQARRELGKLVRFTRSSAKNINRALTKAFDIKKKIAKVKRMQEHIPPREPTIREIFREIPRQFLEARGVREARSRSGFTIGTEEIARRNIARREAEQIAREYKEQLPQRQQITPVERREAPIERREAPVERQITRATITRGEINVNLKVDVSGGTTAGTIEQIVEQLFEHPKFAQEFELRVLRITGGGS